MKTVYLKNGQQANLIEKIGERFVIQRIMTYENYDYEGNSYPCEVESDEEVVSEIFDNPPKQKIDSEILELESKKKTIAEEIKTLQNDRSKLTLEINSIQRTKIDNEKFIINRSELLKAKEVAYFTEKGIIPVVKDKNLRGIKISLTISISDGEERAWGYKIYDSESDSYGDYLDKKYGVIINPTSEQLDEIIIKRLSENRFEDRQISYVDDKYLSEKQIEIKKTYLDNQKQTELTRKRNEIEKLKEQLDRLENPDKYLPKP